MSLTLTPAQIAELQTKRDADDYAGAYDLMESWTAGSADPDVELVHTWLLGAGDINRGEGPFAALVKAYNQRQGLLRGRPVSLADNQEASDRIAQLIINESITGGAIPDFETIVEFDAEGGRYLYRDPAYNGDTTQSQAANWTGTFLISPFGFDETDRLLSTGASDVAMDTLDDLKNVLFAHDAFKAAAWGVKDMDQTVSSWWNSVEAYWDLPETSRLNNFPTQSLNVLDNLIADMMRGRAAESGFELVRSLDKNDTLDQLMSSWQGRRITDTTDDSFVTTAATFFAGIASDTQRNTSLERLDGKSAEELVALANSDAKYRNALLGLSVFALELDASEYASRSMELYDPVSGTGHLSQRYLQDRAATLKLFQEYDRSGRSDHFVNAVGLPFWMWGDAQIQDQASGDRLTVDGWDLGIAEERYLRFGDENTDVFDGDSQNDHLYGMGGDDTLNGKGGEDYLEGGTGDDTYHIDGSDNDTALDVQGDDIYHIEGSGGEVTITDRDGENTYHVSGGATVHIDGADNDDNLYLNANRLSALINVEGEKNTWRSADGSITITHNASLTITDDQGNTIVADNFVDGIFGLNLIDRPQADTTSTVYADNNGGDATVEIDGNLATGDVQGGTVELGQPITAAHGTAMDDVLWLQSIEKNRGISLYGGDGNDDIGVQAEADASDPTDIAGANLYADAGDDHLGGSRYEDWAEGGSGHDWIEGRQGDDLALGGTENDLVTGGSGEDKLFGQLGIDHLYGGAGKDHLEGGDGADRLYGDTELGSAVSGWSGEMPALSIWRADEFWNEQDTTLDLNGGKDYLHSYNTLHRLVA